MSRSNINISPLRTRTDTFEGVGINPTDDDDVSAVTEAVRTVAPHPEYMSYSSYDVEQPSRHSNRGSRTATNILDEPTVDGYDDFFDKVFNAPASVADTKDYDGKGNNSKKGWVLAATGILFIVLAVIAVLFGTGIIEIEDSSSSTKSNSAIVGATKSPTPAPIVEVPKTTKGETATPTVSPTTMAPSTGSPTLSPTTQMPTLPDSTPFPTQAPVTPAPSDEPSAEPTATPTLRPSAPPTRSPTLTPTLPPVTDSPTNAPTNAPIETTVEPTLLPTPQETQPGFVLSRLRVRMEEEPYGVDLVPNYSVTKDVTLTIRVGGETYNSYTEKLLVLNDWTYFPDTTNWYRDGSSGPEAVDTDGLVPGVMSLRVSVDGGSNYIWTDIEASDWGTRSAQSGYQTDSIQNINGNGPFMRWEFDVYPASYLP